MARRSLAVPSSVLTAAATGATHGATPPRCGAWDDAREQTSRSSASAAGRAAAGTLGALR